MVSPVWAMATIIRVTKLILLWTENINRFLNSVYELSQTFSGDEQSRKAASAFSDYAEELYHHLSDVYSAAAGGKYSLVEYGSIYSSENKPYFENYLDFANGREDELFNRTEDVYAGGGHFAVLYGKETVSLDFAKEKAKLKQLRFYFVNFKLVNDFYDCFRSAITLTVS